MKHTIKIKERKYKKKIEKPHQFHLKKHMKQRKLVTVTKKI